MQPQNSAPKFTTISSIIHPKLKFIFKQFGYYKIYQKFEEIFWYLKHLFLNRTIGTTIGIKIKVVQNECIHK